MAYRSLSNNFNSANRMIFEPPQQGQTFAQTVPIAIVRPLVGATDAISLTLHGLSNSLKNPK